VRAATQAMRRAEPAWVISAAIIPSTPQSVQNVPDLLDAPRTRAQRLPRKRLTGTALPTSNRRIDPR
jgi:hypothetical protein